MPCAPGSAPAPNTRSLMDNGPPSPPPPADPAAAYIISEGRKTGGRVLIATATLGLAAIILYQMLFAAELTSSGFETWRPVLYAYVAWGIALGAGQVMI